MASYNVFPNIQILSNLDTTAANVIGLNADVDLTGKSLKDFNGAAGINGQVLAISGGNPVWSSMASHAMGSAEIFWSTNFGVGAEYTTSGVGTAGTPGGALLAPVTTLNTAYMFDMPANGRLRYTGAGTINCHVAFSLSIRGIVGAAKDMRFYLKKTGTTVTGSGYRFTLKGSAEYQSIAAHKVLQLTTNDYLEIWAQNITDATEMNVTNFNLQLMFSA